MPQRIFLQKQDKNIEANKLSGTDKLPYFKLTLPPEQDGGEWIEVGALWKAKSGNGYSGKLNEGITIVVDQTKIYKKQTSQD